MRNVFGVIITKPYYYCEDILFNKSSFTETMAPVDVFMQTPV